MEHTDTLTIRLLHAVDLADVGAVDHLLRREDCPLFVNNCLQVKGKSMTQQPNSSNCALAECALLVLHPTTGRYDRAMCAGPDVYDTAAVDRLREIFQLLLTNKHIDCDVRVELGYEGRRAEHTPMCCVRLEQLVVMHRNVHLMTLIAEHGTIENMDRFVCEYLRNGDNLYCVPALLKRARRPIHYAVDKRHADVVRALVTSEFEPHFGINECAVIRFGVDFFDELCRHVGPILHRILLLRGYEADRNQADAVLEALLKSPSIRPTLPRIPYLSCYSPTHMKPMMKHESFDIHCIPPPCYASGMMSRACMSGPEETRREIDILNTFNPYPWLPFPQAPMD